MDVGSGGGSPAIPLKLASPSAALTMVEVKARKSAFLREAIRTLQLDNTTVETSRYEELLARPELHESVSVLSLRAVRVELRSLMTLQAFLRPGGSMFMFRGPGGPKEPQSVPMLRWVGARPLVDSLQSRLTCCKKLNSDRSALSNQQEAISYQLSAFAMVVSSRPVASATPLPDPLTLHLPPRSVIDPTPKPTQSQEPPKAESEYRSPQAHAGHACSCWRESPIFSQPYVPRGTPIASLGKLSPQSCRVSRGGDWSEGTGDWILETGTRAFANSEQATQGQTDC